MVKKLFYYEFKSYLRALVPVNLILLAIAVMTRLLQLFETESISYYLLYGSSLSAYFITAFVAMLLTTITVIVRFYKNLFSAEGYLTFTLPVTSTQHILTKLVTGVCVGAITTVCLVLSGMILTAGELLVEIFKAIGYLFKQIFVAEMGWHIALYILELLLVLILSAAYQNLVIYACIALGQRSSKNRIMMAIVCYFAYYMISETVSTVLTLIITTLADSLTVLEAIGKFFTNHPLASIHIFFLISIAVVTGLGILAFYIIKKTVDTRLNLE
ncbi:MAG: hypothetical protein IKC63_03290 [Clostridia bacterium]|nr:hypothetical protein [Clostridia bacterium]